MDEIPLAKHKGKPATKLKFDLDLPPEAVDTTSLTADLTYPEWDYTRKPTCRTTAACWPHPRQTKARPGSRTRRPAD